MARPRAKNAALRSSSRTWVRRRSARASASGVEREPGQITASATPSRAHSSTRVALNVACTLTRRATPCRSARLGAATGRAARIHADRSALGPLRRASGRGARPGGRGPSGPRRLRLRAGRPARRPPQLVAETVRATVGRRTVRSARLLPGRPGGPARPHRDRSGRRPRGPHRRDRRDRGCCRAWHAAAESDEAIADELEAAGDVERFVDGWLRGPLFARLSSTEAADRAERLRNSAAGLASSLRLCGTGTQEPLWDRLSSSDAVPSWPWRERTTARFAAHALRMARLAPAAVASLVPGAAMPCISPSPSRRGGSCVTGSGRRARSRRCRASPDERVTDRTS